MNEIGLRDKST